MLYIICIDYMMCIYDIILAEKNLQNAIYNFSIIIYNYT